MRDGAKLQSLFLSPLASTSCLRVPCAYVRRQVAPFRTCELQLHRSCRSARRTVMLAASDLMQQHWSKGAKTYTEFSGEGGLLPLHQKVLSVVRESSQSSEALAILDIACGDGEPACSLAKQHPHASVLATDYAPGMIEEAKKKAAALGVQNIKFAVANAMDLHEYADDSFDILTCVAALFMVPDFNKAVREFKRVLKPGGFMLATTWGLPEETNMACALRIGVKSLMPDMAPPPQRAPELDPSRLASEEGLHEICSAAGFHDTHTEKFNLRFRFPKESFVYPDGPMLTHPMVTVAVANMEAAGVQDSLKKLTGALEKVYDDYGYRDTDGNFDFPTNIAVIATAVA